MTMLSPLIDTTPAIQIHVLCACVAILLAPVQIFRTRRDKFHKVLGYIWVAAMALTALSSFWINDLQQFGAFSLIHLLSVYVLYGLVQSIRAAMRKDIETHSDWMKAMSLWALLVAGAFTFAPGRALNRVVFPEAPVLGFAIVLAVAGVCLAAIYGRRFVLQRGMS